MTTNGRTTKKPSPQFVGSASPACVNCRFWHGKHFDEYAKCALLPGNSARLSLCDGWKPNNSGEARRKQA